MKGETRKAIAVIAPIVKRAKFLLRFIEIFSLCEVVLATRILLENRMRLP